MPDGQTIDQILSMYQREITAEMRAVLTTEGPLASFYGMMRYHLGWVASDLTPQPTSSGKLLRPTLCLLACEAAGGKIAHALAAAAAIELVHNFSLIHDDIEDRDEQRRHRPTLWKIWGEAQAINAGDGLFCLARLALWHSLERGLSSATTLQMAALLDRACLTLCEGQYLDISFEQRQDVSEAEYMDMIARKTAALIETAVVMGAHAATPPDESVALLRSFAHALGMAFQVRDDLLGVWASHEQLGKVAAGDVRRKKKSLPFLHTREYATPAQQQELYSLYENTTLDDTAVSRVLQIMEETGTRRYCQEALERYCEEARAPLERLRLLQPEATALDNFATIVDFLNRDT